MDRAIGFYPTGREFESLRGCVSKYDNYERDEMIRHAKKKTKPKKSKSDHKHQYFERYVAEGHIVPVTEKVCSICGRSSIVKYHFGIFKR